MPIVVKEVIVKTTVEQKTPQSSTVLGENMVETIKRLVREELVSEEMVIEIKRYSKNRR